MSSRSTSVWLGKLPDGWRYTKLKRIVEPSRPITYGIVQAGPMVEGGIPYIRPADMTDERGVPNLDGILRTSEEIAAGYRRSTIRAGDLVCSIGPSFGKVMTVPDELHGANLTQGTARVAISSQQSSRYYFWVLRASTSYAQWESSVGGATFKALNLEPLAETIVPEPPFAEQLDIAAFLDRETSKIDALVEEQKRLIELLKEKRQAVISHAVTRGLSPNVLMKPSSVKWLGDVPAHWEVVPLKSLLREAPCYGVLVPEHADNGIPMLRITDIYDGRARREELATISPELSEQYRRTILVEGDVALAVVGTIGRALMVESELAGANCSRAIARLQTHNRTLGLWLLQIFMSKNFAMFVDLTCVGTAQRVLNMGDLSSARFATPPEAEMLEILSWLEKATIKIDGLLRSAQSAIALLAERRSALISAAVTGKIAVSEIVVQREVA